MESDTEKYLIQGIGDLQKEVKSLKKQLSKLSDNFKHMELLALQDQISAFSDKIKLIDNSILLTKRAVARLEIESLTSHIRKAISLSLTGVEKVRAHDHITVQSTRALSRLEHSSKPISDAKDFRLLCIDCSNEYKLNAFI